MAGLPFQGGPPPFGDARGGPTSFPTAPPPGFSGVFRPGFVPPGCLNPYWVKDAVLGLRSAAAAANASTAPGADSRPAADSTGSGQSKDASAKAGEAKDADNSSSGPSDLYKILEVAKGADEAAIKKSYRKLVLQWHPDKHPKEREVADVRIRQINNAYETLGNPAKRIAYDQMMEALERKKNGIRLETSWIKPRMSIPKEFMLCPLGHLDKFVRVVQGELRVQSREDTRGVHFQEFFQKAKFSLWWLPEVNNMCRLRTAESAAQGVETGMNVTFVMDGAPTSNGQISVKETDVSLSSSDDPRYANLIAVASPYSQGAFRFEGAFWPGHFLSFREPSAVRMAGLVDEQKDITDFILVDYSAMFQHMNMDEALAGPVSAATGGDCTEYVKLSDLRADLSVRMYFQNTLGRPVWNNKEFETFFEAHYEVWDFDAKRARVRLRPMPQPAPEAEPSPAPADKPNQPQGAPDLAGPSRGSQGSANGVGQDAGKNPHQSEGSSGRSQPHGLERSHQPHRDRRRSRSRHRSCDRDHDRRADMRRRG